MVPWLQTVLLKEVMPHCPIKVLHHNLIVLYLILVTGLFGFKYHTVEHNQPETLIDLGVL